MLTPVVSGFTIDLALDDQGCEPYKLGSDIFYKIGSTYTIKFKDKDGNDHQLEFKRDIFTTARDSEEAVIYSFTGTYAYVFDSRADNPLSRGM